MFQLLPVIAIFMGLALAHPLIVQAFLPDDSAHAMADDGNLLDDSDDPDTLALAAAEAVVARSPRHRYPTFGMPALSPDPSQPPATPPPIAG